MGSATCAIRHERWRKACSSITTKWAAWYTDHDDLFLSTYLFLLFICKAPKIWDNGLHHKFVCLITSSLVQPCMIHHVTFSDIREHEQHMPMGSYSKNNGLLRTASLEYILEQVSDLPNANGAITPRTSIVAWQQLPSHKHMPDDPLPWALSMTSLPIFGQQI